MWLGLLALSYRASQLHTFYGYALAQLKRIETHHKWLRDPPQEPPNREYFGLPSQQKLMTDTDIGAFNKMFAEMLKYSGQHHESEEFIRFYCNNESPFFQDWMSLVQAASGSHLEQRYSELLEKSMGFSQEMLDILSREKAYKRAYDYWKQYENWKATRNPARAALEAKYGYDTKHAMHLVRLLRMGKEVLQDQELIVFREQDREELLTIRNGAWTIDQLREYAETQKYALNHLVDTSSLPKRPDFEKLNTFHQDLVSQFLGIEISPAF